MPPISLGVVIVTFNAADVILDCLESLLAATDVTLQIVIVDNASTDRTAGLLHDWAVTRHPYVASSDIPFHLLPCAKPVQFASETDNTTPDHHQITLIEAGVNGGFAAGVNRGLSCLARKRGIDRFWVLNPDCVVPPGTPAAFARMPVPEDAFALMGGRVLYLDGLDTIQLDGGTINWYTGVTSNINQGLPCATTPKPDPANVDFVTGASLVVSRRFYDMAGPMQEDYFLYYEEVDWAMRRGSLPLIYCPEAIIYHRVGTAIGSPTLARSASAFSLFFKFRGRIRFLRRFRRFGLPGAYAYSFAKAVQLLLKGSAAEAWTIVVASLDGPPPKVVRDRLSPAAAAIAFRRGPTEP